VSPFTLYYNQTLILPPNNQWWRVITSFGYFGTFNLDFGFHMYFLVRYARMLEEGEFVRQVRRAGGEKRQEAVYY